MPSSLTVDEFKEFVVRCTEAMGYWQMHRVMFDTNERGTARMEESMAREAYQRWAWMSHDYTLLQIRKLHDPSTVSRKGRVRKNLTLNYVIEHGGWTGRKLRQLTCLKAALDSFGEQLKDARDWIISHTDLDTVLAKKSLGGFAAGEDGKYFARLDRFVDLVGREVTGDPWEIPKTGEADAAFLRRIQNRGIASFAESAGLPMTDPVGSEPGEDY